MRRYLFALAMTKRSKTIITHCSDVTRRTASSFHTSNNSAATVTPKMLKKAKKNHDSISIRTPSKHKAKIKRISGNVTNANRVNKKQKQNKKLPTPTILYTDEHLIVVNKPEGWHSIPNDIPTKEKEKCLLTYVQDNIQSKQIKPLHRIDQPVTGILLFSKTKIAAQNITKIWKLGYVRKEYLCMVRGHIKIKATSNTNDNSYVKSVLPQKGKEYVLTGILRIRPRTKGKSVIVEPNSHYILPSNYHNNKNHQHHNVSNDILKKGHRLCQIHYRILNTSTINSTPISLLSIQSYSGARHQIRAMLSYLLQTPVLGDLRYNSIHNNNYHHDDANSNRNIFFPLPNQSVALHARRLFLPCNSSTRYDYDEKNKDINATTEFIAPLPKDWNVFFNSNDDDVCKLEHKWGFET